MIKKITLVSALFLSGLQSIYAQDVCGTDRFLKKHLETNPKAKQSHDARKESLKLLDHNQPKSEQAANRVIPVVFHIIHQYGSENISKSIIDETLDIMNRDWQGTNEYVGSITSTFAGVSSDLEVEFRLATLDPNGNCTEGITRTYSTLTEGASDNVKDLVGWPNTKYLNIWVVKSIEEDGSGAGTTLGYAYYPNVMNWNPGIDGIVCRADALGANSSRSGRTMSHEIGHYLGLAHTFEGSCGFDGDDCPDTPIENGNPNFGCDYAYNPCGTSLPANVENIMSYSSCVKMFTNDQKDIVDNTFQDYRYVLISNSNLNATGTQAAGIEPNCKPIADFKSNTQIACQGESIDFIDLTYNGTPTNWNWTFNGGNPASSSDQSPTIQYNTPGTYTVSLVTSNDQGQTSFSQPQYIQVLTNVAENSNPPYSEGFEASPLSNGLWSIENPNNDLTWSEVSSGMATGSKCMRINNSANSTDGEVDALISNSYNFSLLQDLVFSFKVAYRQKTSTDNDQLKVYFSTNCGKTWLIRYSKIGSSLATTTASTASFVPNPSQYRTDEISISPTIKASSNVRFKFEFTSGGGNNIYIDDINITGTVGIDDPAVVNQALVIFPNPANESAELNYYSPKGGLVTFEVIDILGKVILSESIQSNTGDNSISFNKSQISQQGIYFLKVKGNGFAGTGKLILQ
jgi:PKD repeat protein